MSPIYHSTRQSIQLSVYKMPEHTKIEKSQVLAPQFCDYFAAPVYGKRSGRRAPRRQVAA